MRNALILHATANSSKGNWYSWLKTEFIKTGWKVWLPDLPHSEKPSIEVYNNFIFSNTQWEFNSSSMIIGHSSGAVAALGLLQYLPDDVQIDTCILVSVFKDNLGWDALRDLFFMPLDFEKIKHKAKKFVVIHSDDDPHCPLEGAVYIASKLNVELILKHGEGHFNLERGIKYKQLPFILDYIK